MLAKAVNIISQPHSRTWRGRIPEDSGVEWRDTSISDTHHAWLLRYELFVFLLAMHHYSPHDGVWVDVIRVTSGISESAEVSWLEGMQVRLGKCSSSQYMITS